MAILYKSMDASGRFMGKMLHILNNGTGRGVKTEIAGD